MGRIKTRIMKRVSNELIENHLDKFTDNFEENKKIVEKYSDSSSKKLRNIITGYVTRLVKSKERL
ncbi:MAG: 30S ribosomal protein S17e [Candidatus Woesearchaeota archaeon]